MDQVATLTTGWEPDTPLDDSVLRQFAFACADRVAWMAQATHGRVDRDAARPAVLLASDDGRNNYRQLGFLGLARLTIWEHQPAKP